MLCEDSLETTTEEDVVEELEAVESPEEVDVRVLVSEWLMLAEVAANVVV